MAGAATDSASTSTLMSLALLIILAAQSVVTAHHDGHRGVRFWVQTTFTMSVLMLGIFLQALMANDARETDQKLDKMTSILIEVQRSGPCAKASNVVPTSLEQLRELARRELHGYGKLNGLLSQENQSRCRRDSDRVACRHALRGLADGLPFDEAGDVYRGACERGKQTACEDLALLLLTDEHLGAGIEPAQRLLRTACARNLETSCTYLEIVETVVAGTRPRNPP